MKRHSMLTFAALLAVSLLSSSAYADHAVKDTLGSPLRSGGGPTVQVDASTSFIRVEHLASLTIRNARGQSFSWKFDTFHVPTGFPLKRIAPADFDAGDTWVYVHRPAVVVSD